MLSSQSFSRPHPFLPLASRCRQPLVAADSPCYRRPPPPPIHTTANTKTPPAPRLHHHKHHPLPLCHLPPLPLCRQCYGIDRHSTVADIASRTPPPSKIDIEIIRSYYETPEGFRGRRRECLGKYATDLGHMRATDTHRIGFPTAGLPHVCDEPAAKYALRCGFVAYGCRIRTEACLQCLFDACVRRIRTEAGDCLSICRHCFDQRDLFLPTSQLSAKTSCTPTETLPRRKEHGCAPSWQTIYIRYDSAFSATAHGRE